MHGVLILSAGLILISIFFVIIVIPCVGVSVLGVKMLNQLGQFPSKTPAIQLSIVKKLVLFEVIGFTLLIIFYHYFADYESEIKQEQVQTTAQ